jgi:hypothetical protein
MGDATDYQRPNGYEKPKIKRHAVVMTMAPAGCKMGHGLFPFMTKPLGDKKGPTVDPSDYAYRRV